MIREMIQKAVKGEDLLEDEMVRVMDQIMEGKATDAQIGAFITALRMKGETIEEITEMFRPVLVPLGYETDSSAVAKVA